MKDIRELKNQAVLLPEPLRTLVLTEPDEVPDQEFYVKMKIWLKLIKISKQGGES